VYVGNLSYRATEEDLRELFSEYRTVTRITIPTERNNPDRKRGFAFVELTDENDEQDAINALDQITSMGRQLKVNKARPREPRPQRPTYSDGPDRY
jgi:RNA recognition motif-containing protein